VTLQLFQGSTL